ncbi:YjiG family protein [Endozoicomonas ascidiicola]|uniref:YjiG family protein n=1 Tax=Endozoicomonas ascidiicola TaxID=1698521 RepID=UPI00082C5B2F|nr:YjiG family protein [Endozoicomonas ascidiicola]
MSAAPESKKMITDVFVEGARKGWGIGIGSIIPNIMMAFIIIKILSLTGALNLLAVVFGPVMAVFGVPGEGAAVLMAAVMSMGGAVGVAVGLLNEGALHARDIAILAPAIYLMGSTIQYAGRILGVVGTDGRRYPIMFGICIMNALMAMFVMNILV